MQPHVFSYPHSWTPAGVDTANTGQLPSSEKQSEETQGGCYKGPAAVTSLPNTSPKACASRGALQSLETGSHGDASWEQGFLVKAPEE